MAALLPHVNTQKAQFKPLEIANLLWAMAKLAHNGQEQTPGLKEAVGALLPHVRAQKANFKPLEITNLLWAMATLVDNGQEQTPELNEAVAVPAAPRERTERPIYSSAYRQPAVGHGETG